MVSDISRKIAGAADALAPEKKYWQVKLSGDWEKSVFPYTLLAAESTGSDNRFGSLDFEISGNVHARLIGLSSSSDPTLHIVLAAAVTTLLYKYCGNRDLIIGTPVYRQSLEENFLNTVLPLRLCIMKNTSFKDLLVQTRDTLLEAIKNQNFPMDVLVTELGLPGPEQGFPLFDVSVLLKNIHDPEYIRHIPNHFRFSFLRTETKLDGRIDFNGDKYQPGFIRQVKDHFINLLEKVTVDLDKPLSGIEILLPAEKKKHIDDFNDTACELPGEKMLHHLFEEQVQRTPGNIAAVMGDDSISFSRLNQAANVLAESLKASGAGPGTIVAVKMNRSIELITAILGILKTGAAYLPIDPYLPESRQAFMLKDSNAILCIDSLESRSAAHTGKNLGAVPLKNVNRNFSPSTPIAYIIYTSGTTGKPKGVVLTHRGVVNYITWAAGTYVNQESLPFPLYTGINFDLTVTSIFVPLITGNPVYIYDGDPREPLIHQVLEDNKAGVIKLTPAHLKMIANGAESSILGNSKIRRFILGGENLETATAGAVQNSFKEAVEIYNEYGPTETVVGSMIHKFQAQTDTGHSVPIGKPIANTRIYLLDNDLNPVPTGVPGEIYIGGSGVAAGYLNRPELTVEKFVTVFGGDVYKTGDLAVRQMDGNIIFLGRGDQQVKIRGFRVEPAEIEFHLKSFQKHETVASILTDKNDLLLHQEKIRRCCRCLLSDKQPGIRFDADGVCHVCLEFETYKPHTENYFKSPHQLEQLFQNKWPRDTGYDCLLLFSGGKDSTYALYRLIDMGLKVLSFTFDNGFISPAAFENIHRTTRALGVNHITGSAGQMEKVFVESLESSHSVCHGCWHALNTYGAALAHEHGISRVVSGLSRGQIFDMRLYPLFQTGVFKEDEIDERLLLFRKNFHSMENKFSRILEKDLAHDVVETVQFVDLFRYYDTQVMEVKDYLSTKGWVQPEDTGFCSSNCMINDTGIYMHLKERGCHFYEAPLSWDVRLGQMSREHGLREVSFIPRPEPVDRVLEEIGYYRSGDIRDAVVLDQSDGNGNAFLCAYLVSGSLLTAAELRKYLAAHLPDYMIPSRFIQVEKIPLSPGGKVDRPALEKAGSEGKLLTAGAKYISPANEKETLMADLFKEILNLEKVGIQDNFFELGATSFDIVQVAGQLALDLKQEIPVIKLFEYPSISSFMDYLGEDQQQQGTLKEVDEPKQTQSRDRVKERFAKRRKMRK